MKGKLIAAAAGFIALLALIIALLCGNSENTADKNIYGSLTVAVNEIEQLIRSGEADLAAKRAGELRADLSEAPEAENGQNSYIWLIFGASAAVIAAVFVYIWFAVLRPFEKLQKYAENISTGNFDIPLNYERANYFGKFTWAFDNMRREIIKARACEKEAIENNKTVIATLSHDIKTPIASIRAYTEGLEAGLDGTPEKRQKYLTVIMNKCDEVARLTDDMFLHSLSDLDKLKMNPEAFDFCEFVQTVVRDIGEECGDVKFDKPAFSVCVSADKNRLTQIIGNIIANARKYAKTDIDVKITRGADNVCLCFRDYGEGIADEDIPFIFDKFYRGSRTLNENGAGLGLYIVKYVVNRSGGEVYAENLPDGFQIKIILPEAGG